MTESKTTSERPLPPRGLSAKEVHGVANGVQAVLLGHLSMMTSSKPIISTETIKHVRKRVLPRLVEPYSAPEKVISLASLDIDDLGLRMVRYQYIARYQDAAFFEDAEMKAAFGNHVHALRGSELYVILERAGGLLSFLHCIASDFAVASGPQAASFEKTFRKLFDRHLRERHRIVHAHERPSVISRLLSLTASDCTDPKVGALLVDTIRDVVPRISGTIGLTETPEPQEVREKINAFRLADIDDEAASMWRCFLTSLERTIDRKLLRHQS